MKKYYLFIIAAACSIPLWGQDTTSSAKTLESHLLDIVVYSFTAPEVIALSDLNRYSNTSILPAVNTIPGVRMEERSPSSYRFGIRGSSAQTPFGVRNVKAYYNGIPFTDAGGNTYLNQLGFYNINNLSVKKGPSGSLYGAGTGGVLLINSLPDEVENIARVHYTAGSYGLQSAAGEVFISDTNSRQVIRYQHAEADGYRQQSASRKGVFSYDAALRTGQRNTLKAHLLYSKLTYQTPGGLTLAQYQADSRAARPGTTTIPGAVENKATVYQESFLAGITNEFRISTRWENTTALFASYNQLINPTIRNYSRSAQPNTGITTAFRFNAKKGRSTYWWTTGGEALQQFATEKTYTNNAGTPGTLTNDVEINNLLAFAYTHLQWQYRRLIVSGGISINTSRVRITSLLPAYSTQSAQFNNQLAPAITAKYWLRGQNNVYVLAEKGYTPPSVSELSPTGSNINLGLRPSQGWNYAVGSQGYFFGRRLFYDVSLFHFRLSQAIVQRRDSAGGDYYINSGGTYQSGAEALVRYTWQVGNKNELLKKMEATLAYTGYQFTYRDFTQLSANYTGNRLPGVPDHVVSLSVDADMRPGIYANLSYYYCSAIYLNDANTDRAVDYTLLGARLGYRKSFKRVLLDVYAGGDNLLNKKYSLGNDINAAGGRYYNAAPGVNFFAGLSLGFRYRLPRLPAPGAVLDILD